MARMVTCLISATPENRCNPYKPIRLRLQPGTGVEFCEMVGELLKLLSHHLDAERIVTRIMWQAEQ